jgi:hypothetical protein
LKEADSNEDIEYKRQEARVRRLARRQGLVLQKSRVRMPELYEWSRYRLIDANTGWVVAGAQGGFSLNLDEAQEFLSEPA